jgi:hypothetical protein
MTNPRIMSYSTDFRALPALGRSAVITLACIFGLPTILVPATRADESGAALRPLDDSLPALPLTGTFEKEDGDNGPFGLVLKNTSGNPIKASGVLISSVDSKAREIPEHLVERAETWTLYGLSSGDKVTIRAGGFAPLTLTVP